VPSWRRPDALARCLRALAAQTRAPHEVVVGLRADDPDSARALDAKSVEVEFKIANGYYLYRNRFSFATESGEPLADVEIPRGKIKEDRFFGKTETFRDLVRIRMTLSPRDAARGSVNLRVTSQGCADVGVCYVPLEQLVGVRLPGGSSQ